MKIKIEDLDSIGLAIALGRAWETFFNVRDEVKHEPSLLTRNAPEARKLVQARRRIEGLSRRYNRQAEREGL